jgi:hypothetical protein
MNALIFIWLLFAAFTWLEILHYLFGGRRD